MYRQGDVLIVPTTDSAPSAAAEVPRESGRVVLAHGEATGHHHSLGQRGVCLFRETGSDGVAWLDVTEFAVVEHQEHTPIVLMPGRYRVVRQREYDAGMARFVAD